MSWRVEMDPTDIGPVEEAYALIAEAAGLDVSQHRLIAALHGPGYFATRRFDRPASGERLHMVSLSGAIEAPAHLPSSYDTFPRTTRAITVVPRTWSRCRSPCHQARHWPKGGIDDHRGTRVAVVDWPDF